MTILVIEDEPQMRRNIVSILRMEGYEAFEAENGRMGIVLASRQRPDLIVCDVMMPELDGYGVLRALQDDPATMTIPFLFLTAKSSPADVREGMNLGADDYLVKPVRRMDLLAAIRARLARARQQAHPQFKPDFASAAPLESLSLTPREAEVLLWTAQGKTNGDIAAILGNAEVTVKKHLQNIFEKLGVETRQAAALRALQVLSSPNAGTLKRERRA
jgi:DNA-binding NarL/FixJ family response regulator